MFFITRQSSGRIGRLSRSVEPNWFVTASWTPVEVALRNRVVEVLAVDHVLHRLLGDVR